MPRLLQAFALIIVLSLPAFGEDIGGTRAGADLVAFLRANYRPTVSLSYKQARQHMFGTIDNRNGRVRCVYTGEEVTTTGIPNGNKMNTEHTWPQGMFNERNPMRSDIHHLFPTLTRVNGERDNHPFGEIPDHQTETWWIDANGQANIPQNNRDNYSESIEDVFEPREDHKGNAARAMLYFWVVYGADNISPSFITTQLDTLLQWHQDDPANAAEKDRNAKIAAVQGNHNPFVLDPTLAERIVHGAARNVAPLAARRPRMQRLALADAASQAITIRLAAWNMQSTMNSNHPESDPEFLGELMGEKQGIHLWGLSEVHNADALDEFERGAEEGENGANFESILGRTGGGDRLAVLFDTAVFQVVGQPFDLRDETQLSGGLRASLVVRLRTIAGGKEFLFVVNHLKRGGAQNETRLQQAKNLNTWARGQQLPIIAVGDFNFDYDPELGHLGQPHRDGGFDALTKDDVFQWIQPQRLVKTQASDDFNSVLDFVFIAKAPFGWTGQSRILEREGDQAAVEEDFEDDADNTDHRPVDAILTLGTPPVDAIAPAARAPRAAVVVPADPGNLMRRPLGAQPAARADNSLTLGAWNIEHLGRSGDDTRPEDLADYIIAAQVAVLGLEEIYDTDGNAATQRNAKLDAALEHIKQKTGATWDYRLFPKAAHETPAQQLEQLTGVAWNTNRVTLSGDPLLIPVSHGGTPPNDFWRRQPHAVKFTTTMGRTDFVVIPVHMRSNSRRPGQTADPDELRAAEVESLLEQLNLVREHFDDDDIVVLGDANVLRSDEGALTNFAEGGFRDLNSIGMKTWMSNGVRKSPFDRFFVPDDQPEFADSTQEAVLTFPRNLTAKKFNRDVSDHLLIRTNVKLSDDDD